jgi:CDP-diacylglycerol--glycerol-3-phosphate 3-phosphatidyltransferase
MTKMNLPNKLTIFRAILIVPFIILLLGGNAGWFGENVFVTDCIALAIFIVASLTDLLDGKIARKYNLVTNFGKFMDPLADKLLVCSAMIALVELERIPAWIVIIIISREFIISGFRLIASDNGVVIAASYWGKFKTTFQMVMVCLMIVNIQQIKILTDIVMWIALVLTIVSLIDYLVKNRNVLKA